jgi:putative inorganic carbon (hco3(-)) transporter
VIYYALLSFFVLEYVRPGAYVPGLDALHLNSIVPLTCIIGTIVMKTPVSNSEFFAERNTKIVGALLGLLVVSTLFATVTLYAYDVTTTVFAYILIYWILVRQVGDVRRLKGVFITLTAAHIIIAVLNPAVFAPPAETRVGINSGAFLGDGNDFSLSVNICIPLCLFVMAESKKIYKVFWAGALVTLVLCVIATQSRGGTVGLAAVGLYYWLKSQKKLQTAAVFVLVATIVLTWAPASYFDRMATISDTEESSTKGRIDAWKMSVQMAMANPILGAGAGHFPLGYSRIRATEGTFGRWLTAHSIYFLVLGELGIPGLAVLLTFIVGNLVANRRMHGEAGHLPPDQAATARNALASTSAALVAFATGGAFLSAAYYPHMYVLAGMLTAARHIVRVQLQAREHAGHDAGLETQGERPPLTPAAISPEWRPRHAVAAGRRPFV